MKPKNSKRKVKTADEGRGRRTVVDPPSQKFSGDIFSLCGNYKKYYNPKGELYVQDLRVCDYLSKNNNQIYDKFVLLHKFLGRLTQNFPHYHLVKMECKFTSYRG